MNDISIRRSDSLAAALCRECAIVDIEAMVFHLHTGMNSMALVVVRILMHDRTNRTQMRVDDASHSADRDGRNRMVVDAADVCEAHSLFNQADICARQTSVCPAINQGTVLFPFVFACAT